MQTKTTEMKKMFGWYDPVALLRTAGDVVYSSINGRHADHRLIEAITPTRNCGLYDYSVEYDVGPDGEPVPSTRARQEIWIDYVSDVGDGWDSTYAIAFYLSQGLSLEDSSHKRYETKRGAILIMGGDEVYPTASRSEYESRLVGPYEAALKKTKPPDHPHLFAVPGNHDWYDSLTSFTRLFCAQRWLGGWKTRQERSYFALKLPNKWWLMGTDIQLGSEIDDPQVEYFRRIAEAEMEEDDRIILCNAEPHWIYAHLYHKSDSDYNESNLAFLENKIFKGRVAVFVAGDLHHYRRHEASDGTQKITAGGGGAFLHPTHGTDVSLLREGEADLRKDVPPREFRCKPTSQYPSHSISRRLCWRNWGFVALNPKFGVLTGILYLLTSWAVMAPLCSFGWSNVGGALRQSIISTMTSQTGALWIGLVLLALVLFTDTHKVFYRWAGGIVHGGFHLLAIFLLGWAIDWTFCLSSFRNHTPGFCEFVSKLLLGGALMFAGGWIVGSGILGVYLWASLNVFRRHQNEAFSSLHIPDYKNFLRLHINQAGKLTIHSIGIDRVPRKWTEVETDGQKPRFEPADKAATSPFLIEEPTVFPKPVSASSGDITAHS